MTNLVSRVDIETEAGRYRGTPWTFKRNILVQYHDIPEHIVRTSKVGPSELMLQQVVNLGIQNMVPCSAVWSNDTFSAITHNGQQIVGRIIGGRSAGRPESISYHYQGTTGMTFQVEYDYANEATEGIPSYMPARIRSSMLRTGQRPVGQTFVVQSMILTNNSIPDVLFDPFALTPAKQRQVVVYTNQTHYARSKTGNLVRIPVQKRPGSARELIIFVVGTVATLSAMLFLRERKRMRRDASQRKDQRSPTAT